MLTCREVSTLISTGEAENATFVRTLGLSLHLTMCRHCRAFRRQVEAIGQAFRALGRQYADELPSGFEAGVVDRLTK